MKKIKKPKFLPQTCLRCGGVFRTHARDLRSAPDSFSHVADMVKCPFCKTIQTAKFKKEETDNANS